MDIRLDALPSDPAALQAIIRAQASALRSRDTLIDRLRAQLAALKRARFGASSEKLERAIEQLELMLEDGEATLAEAAPTGSPAEPAATPDRPARQAPPPHLPREEVRHEPAPVCPDCGGGKLRKRGEDVTEVLEYVPASFRVIRHVRRHCRARTGSAGVRPRAPKQRFGRAPKSQNCPPAGAGFQPPSAASGATGP